MTKEKTKDKGRKWDGRSRIPTKKYKIQHFFIWNSRPTIIGGKKYGDYVHFASNVMNNMIDEGTIRFSPAGINNIDPSLAGGAPYS